ncbi:hypothetical protein Tco_0268409 [Tanacetum coccineum]
MFLPLNHPKEHMSRLYLALMPFTALQLFPAIYLQQFWNTMKYNEKTRVYSCQVDEQWFDLSADLLRKAYNYCLLTQLTHLSYSSFNTCLTELLWEEFTHGDPRHFSHDKQSKSQSQKPFNNPRIIQSKWKMVAENTKKTPQESQAMQPATMHAYTPKGPHHYTSQTIKPAPPSDKEPFSSLLSWSLDPAFLPQGRAHVGGVTIRDPVSETTSKLHEVVGNVKGRYVTPRDQTPYDSTRLDLFSTEDDTSEKVIAMNLHSRVSIPVSDPEKAHEALAGPDPEPIKEDQTRSDSLKITYNVSSMIHQKVILVLEATTITTSLLEITTFITLQLRVARLEQEMSEVKKIDHSADVLASIKSQVPTASFKNQESEKSPKEIIQNKKEQGEEKQDSTYSIRQVKDHKRKSDSDDEKTMMLMKALRWIKPGRSTKRRRIDSATSENKWANTYATTYKVHEENKLQRKTYDIGSFIKWFCRRTGKKKLCKADLEGPAFNLVKAFHKNNVFLQYQMDECHKLLTNKVDLNNPEGHQILRSVYEPLPLGGPPGQTLVLEELVPSLWVESEREVMNIMRSMASLTGGLGERNSTSTNTVFEKYGYNYLREIILRRADYQEYKISEKDFKIFNQMILEDLFLLKIKKKLNHLPKTDKTSLHTAVNMWIRNLVIRNRVGDLQLGIESYQTKINLECPNWDAADYYFKEDYTIVPKPRAVVYRDRNDQRKLMRLNELHKFSDGTLTRVMEKLDHMVKDFHLFEYNKGMETRKWSEDDKRRSKDFITAIEKRLQIRRIYQSLESFVGGRIRDIAHRLFNRNNVTTLSLQNKRRKSASIKGKVPTEIELVLDYTQQVSSQAVPPKAPKGLKNNKEHPSETMVFHNEDGNPARDQRNKLTSIRIEGKSKDGDGDGNFAALQITMNNRNAQTRPTLV